MWFDDLSLRRTDAARWTRRLRRELSRRLRAASAPGAAGLDLLAWGRRYLPEHFSRPPSAMHRWLAEHLPQGPQPNGAKINVLGPRGGAKSTLAALAYPLRAALEGRERYIWIVSDTRHQAHAHLENLKVELADNRRLARDYPHAAGRGPVWRAGTIVLANGVAIEAFGTGQRIRGRRRRADRPTLVICDDLQNDGHMESARQRELARHWFYGTLLKAGTPATVLVNLATALHPEALAMELTRNPGWDSRVFAAIVRWPDRMDLWQQWEAIYTDVAREDYRQAARGYYDQQRAAMDAGAELLWPECEDLYTLMCMRAEGGHAAFDREKQNLPVNPELCEWPETYFDRPIWFADWPAELRLRTMALDPSKGRDDRRGDYAALVLLGIDAQGLVHAEAELVRRPTDEVVAAAVEAWRRFQPDAFAVEANQFQELLAGQFEAEFARQGVLAARPWTIDNRVNKRVRIRRLGPYLASGRLRFRETPGTRLLVEQLRQFPCGDHDDGPDALEMALRLAGEYLEGAGFEDGLGDRLVGREG